MHSHIQAQSYQFKALPFGLSTAPMEFTMVAKEVKLMTLQRGIRIHQYLDDWLVRARSHHTCLQHTQTLVALCQELRLLVNREKSELDLKQVFKLCRLPVRPERGQGQAPTRALAGLNHQDSNHTVWSGVPGRAVHVPHRSIDSNRKTSPLRSAPYETHTVALEEQLEGTRITRNGDTIPQVAPPSLTMVAGGKQCASRSTITPMLCRALRIKRRVGRSLKWTHCKGNLVPSRKQATHKPPETKSSLSSP